MAKQEYEQLDAQLQKEKSQNASDSSLEEFIKKISNIVEDKNMSSSNINVAISKLQLMYFVQDHNYLNLINMYSKLSDSYKNLVRLEKINKIPKTSKPAILSLIDKLFINNLTTNNISNKNYNNEDNEEDEEDELEDYSNKYESYEGDTVTYKTSKKSNNNNIVKKIESKLFDDLNFEQESTFNENSNSVVLNIDTGEVIN